MRRILGVSSAALILASCSPDREGTIQTEDDEIEYSIDGSGSNAEFRGTDESGREVSVNTGTDVPVNLPAGYSIYPGANVVSNSVVNMGDGSGSIVLMTTSDSPEQVARFYRAQAEAAGIEIAMEMNVQDSQMIAGEGPSGKTFTLNASTNDEGTTAQLMVGENLTE